MVSSVLACALGLHFDATPVAYLWQCLDEEVLRHDLLRGVWYLHSQPPLFNLFLGIVLKLFPTSAPLAFAVVYQGVGLAVLIAVAWLLRHLAVSDWITTALCLLLAVHPTFMVHTRWLFYTLPVALVLLLSAIALLRYCANGTAASAHAFSWLAAALMLTRAPFHPLWFLAILAVECRLLARRWRRPLLVSAIVPLLVVNLWYLKNFELVGTYSASSWLGMNLRRGLGISRDEQAALLAAGRLPLVWAAERSGFPRDLARYPQYLDPRTPPLHPALDAAVKRNGLPNFNHRAYARIAQDMLRGDVAYISTYPGRYLHRVLDAWRLFLQPGPRLIIIDPYYPRTFGAAVAHYRDGVNRLLFLSPVVAETLSPAPYLLSHNLLWIGFPVVLFFGFAQVFRGSDTGALERATHRAVLAYLSMTALWFGLVSNLFEFGENDRIRIEIDPVLIVLLGCAISSVAGWCRGRWRGGASSIELPAG